MPFTGSVVVRENEGDDGSTWQLVEPLAYQGRDEPLVVPEGFETDFASVPTWLTWLIPRYGRYTKAAILHDWLCKRAERGEFRWVDADGVFRRMMRELGVPVLRRWLMWTAVRLHSIVKSEPSSLWTQGIGPMVKLVLITVVAAALLLVPAVVVLTWTALFGVAEAVAYLPARIFSGGEQVNPPRMTLPD
jgi:hypothetical protein